MLGAGMGVSRDDESLVSLTSSLFSFSTQKTKTCLLKTVGREKGDLDSNSRLFAN